MPPLIKLKDQTALVPTNQFKLANYPFEKFNPPQSRVYEIYEQDCNIVIAAATSAGKTVMAELIASYELDKKSGKVIYLAPMKALAKEKLDDWTSEKHHFSKYKMAICTGDYRLTPSRKKELEHADIVVMTSEMLNSRLRNFKSENNEWLKDTSVIVVDESHLLGVDSRGDHLEVGLMKLSEIAPKTRFVLLSATMPNVAQIAEWVGYVLSNKQTYVLESEFRPCPLSIHYELYENQRRYEDNEKAKIEKAMDIINDNEEDRFLVFAHTKRTGELMKKTLKDAGIECEFHNADLDKNDRQDVEKRFRTGNLRVVVATSTLAWGCNLPARRVIILGVHRGISLVEDYDIWQMVGRSGRPGYDPRGDAYILLPESDSAKHMERLNDRQHITSRLLDFVGGNDGSQKHYKTLAFHIVSEIHHGAVSTKHEIKEWYKKSLAYFQEHDMNDSVVDSTLELLAYCGAIREENGKYEIATTGAVASMFYYSPFDVADLRRNFKALFANNMQDSDHVVSMCLGDVDSYRAGIVSKADKVEISFYGKKIEDIFGKDYFKEASIKAGYMYYCLMNGKDGGSCAGQMRGLQFDYPRTSQVLKVLDSMGNKWKQERFFNTVEQRIQYGVEAKLVGLCQVSLIGRVRPQRLYDAGLRTPHDIVARKADIGKLAGVTEERAKEMIESAEMIILGV